MGLVTRANGLGACGVRVPAVLRLAGTVLSEKPCAPRAGGCFHVADLRPRRRPDGLVGSRGGVATYRVL